MPAATMNSVKAAIRQLESSGEKTSVRAVYSIVGGNYRSVATLVKEIREADGQREAAPDEVRALFDGLSDDIFTAVKRIVSASLGTEKMILEQRLQSVEAERDEASLVATELRAQLDEQKTSFCATLTDLEDTKRERDRAVGMLEAREKEVARLNSELAALRSSSQIDLNAVSKSMAEMTAALEGLRQKKDGRNDPPKEV